MRNRLIFVALAASLGVSPTLDAAPRKKTGAAPAKAAAEQPMAAALPDAPYVALNGCPAPATGTLVMAKKIDKKARGKFSIDKAPYISTLDPAELCVTNQKMRSGAGDTAGAMGLSGQVMNTRSARMDLMAIPALELELRPVLEAFAKAWPYAPLERTPKILFRADEAYQAQALPDNTIIVSMGLLEAAQSDSEVLFVLAHEYAHLLLGHFTKAETIAGAKGATQAISVAWQAGSTVNALKHSNGSNMLASAQSGMAAGARRAAPIAEALRFAVDDIFAPSWNRDQENQADALAVDLLVRGNMTIDSYANVFARLQKAFETEKASRDKRKLAADAVQASMGEAMKSFASGSVTTTGLLGGGTGMRGFGSGLLKSAGGALLNNMGNITKVLGGDTHLPPEERRNGLAAYFQAGYPTADPPIDSGALIGRIKAKPDYVRAISTRNAYLKARGSYFAQDYAGATAQLRGLGAGSRSAPTFVNYVAALAARDQGNIPAAASFFDAGRGGGVPNLQLYETYTEMELNAGDVKDSDALIAEGKTRFKDSDHFKSIEIRRNLAAGDAAAAQSVYSACMGVKGRDYITERCKAAMPQAQQQQANPLGFKLPFGG